MLHDLRKDVDYLTISNGVSYRSKLFLCKKLKEPLLCYLKNKYSCNPLIKRDSGEKVKTVLKTYLQENPNYGLSESDVMKYIPYRDRPRRAQPHPPPPSVRINIPPPIPPPSVVQTTIAPPPPPPPIETNNNANVILRNNEALNRQIQNHPHPFRPSRELRRSPINAFQNRSIQMQNNISLFRRR